MKTYKITMMLNCNRCKNYPEANGRVSYFVYKTVDGLRMSENDHPYVITDLPGMISWINGLNMSQIDYLKITEL